MSEQILMSDKARECATEIMLYVANQGPSVTLVQDEITALIHKHFPPAVPVEKLSEQISKWMVEQADYPSTPEWAYAAAAAVRCCCKELKALIAEAESK